MDKKKPVLVTTQNGVMKIQLNRPEDANRINREAMEMISSSLLQAEHDERVKVVLLAGNREHFCSGGRVDADSTQEEKDRYAEAIRNMQRQLMEISTPVIAAVEGDCVAGGNDLLVSADIAVARKGVRFGFPEILHGGFPVMVMINTIDQIPKKSLLPAFYGGELFGTEEALRYGMITCAVDEEAFDSTVQRYIDMILDKPREVIAVGRKAYYGMCPLSYEKRVEYGSGILSSVIAKQKTY